MSLQGIDRYFMERAKAKRGGRLHAYDGLEPSRTALVVVDMQDYYVADDMPSGLQAGQAIVPAINRLAEAVRAARGLVVWVTTVAPADAADWASRAEMTGREGWAKRKMLLGEGGAGTPIFAACGVKPADARAVKTRYSAFIPYPSALSRTLAARRIETVLISGVATSTCCESTARDASQYSYRTVMVSDGNADQSDALHNHTLGKFLCNFGDVRTTDELIEMLARGAQAA